MALTIVLEKVIQMGGGIKAAYYKVTDSDGSGGTLDVSQMFSHILIVAAVDMTTAIGISTTWTEDSENITIGSEGSAADVYKIMVQGY